MGCHILRAMAEPHRYPIPADRARNATHGQAIVTDTSATNA